MGADVTVYDRRTEKLLWDEIGSYDVFVNGILWDTSRKDHIIYKEDLLKMKRGAMIIDISCDRNGGVETSVPTTLDKPVYTVDGITHYAVDHTPTLFYKTISESLSENIISYLNSLITKNTGVDSLSLLQGIFLTQELNQVFCIAGGFLTN